VREADQQADPEHDDERGDGPTIDAARTAALSTERPGACEIARSAALDARTSARSSTTPRADQRRGQRGILDSVHPLLH